MGSGFTASASFLRQLSGRESKNSSKRWSKKGPTEKTLKQMEDLNTCDTGGVVMRKRVMVVVDQSRCAKDAMIWAVTHVANKGDLLTLLHIIPPQNKAQRRTTSPYSSSPTSIADSLASVCKACRPEVDVEALVVEGPRLATVTSQVKKLGASVLILGQKKRSPISCLFKCRNDNFVEQCIGNAECLTMAVRKQSRDVGGYLISTRWQKNFWILTASAILIVGLIELGNGPQTTGCGILRGTARPAIGACIILISFYFIGTPVAIGLTFWLKVGYKRIWWGLLTAEIACALSVLFMVIRTDWEVEADRAKKLNTVDELERHLLLDRNDV